MILSQTTKFLLNFIRALSCEMVVFGHLFWFFSNNQENIFIFIAQIGVLLFFLVSGILISNMFFGRDPSPTFKQFLVNRFSRIYTTLLPCIVLIVFIDYIHFSINPTHFIEFFGKQTFLDPFTLIGNILLIQHATPFNISALGDAFILWTLNIEWWLYLSFGWLICYFNKISQLKPKYVIITAVLFVYPTYLLICGQSLIFVWWFGVLTLLLLLLLKNYNIQSLGKMAVILLTLSVVRFIFILRNNLLIYDLPFEILLFSGLTCLFILTNKLNNIPHTLSKVVLFVSQYSYTLYLIHFTVMSFLFLIFQHMFGIFIAPIVFILTNMIAWGVAQFTESKYKTVEAFILKFKIP